jgi:acyl carrier protein
LLLELAQSSHWEFAIVTNASAECSIDRNAIREIVTEQIGVPVDIASLEDHSDLYAAGLTSLATVGLMLAIEDRFEVEFPESLLSRGTFRSIASIAEAVSSLAN